MPIAIANPSILQPFNHKSSSPRAHAMMMRKNVSLSSSANRTIQPPPPPGHCLSVINNAKATYCPVPTPSGTNWTVSSVTDCALCCQRYLLLGLMQLVAVPQLCQSVHHILSRRYCPTDNRGENAMKFVKGQKKLDNRCKLLQNEWEFATSTTVATLRIRMRFGSPLGLWFIDQFDISSQATRKDQNQQTCEKMAYWLHYGENTNINDRFRARQWMIYEPFSRLWQYRVDKCPNWQAATTRTPTECPLTVTVTVWHSLVY